MRVVISHRSKNSKYRETIARILIAQKIALSMVLHIRQCFDSFFRQTCTVFGKLFTIFTRPKRLDDKQLTVLIDRLTA